MISHLAGVPVASRGVTKTVMQYNVRGMKVVEGDYEPPDPLWEGCPVMYHSDVEVSLLSLWGHLTFDPDTAAITHVAPSLVSFCAAMYGAVHKDADPQQFFSGSTPSNTVLGCAVTIFTRRLRKRSRWDNPLCAYSEHDSHSDRLRVSSPNNLSIYFYGRFVCDDCMERLNFRHRAPTAREVGVGYLAVVPLKRRTQKEVWDVALNWLEKLNEIKIVMLLLNYRRTTAISFMMRPAIFVACNYLSEGAVIRRFAVNIARQRLTLTVFEKFCLKRIEQIWGNLSNLWFNGVTLIEFKHRRRQKAVGGVLSFIRDGKYRVLYGEAALEFVLSTIAESEDVLIEIIIANRPTGIGINCATEYCLNTNHLDCAEMASWPHFEHALKRNKGRVVQMAGSLRNSLNGTGLTPFSVLVELAIDPEIKGIVLSRNLDYLAPLTLEEGSVARLVLEQEFLKDPQELPDYGEAITKGRLSASKLLLNLTHIDWNNDVNPDDEKHSKPTRNRNRTSKVAPTD